MPDGTILIVDDEPEMCELIADWLAEEGAWTVDYTTEPLRALEQVSQGHYDVLVTDLRMPDIDGLELARQARGICPDLSVVAVTGYASVHSSVQALREGFVDYLQKPFGGEEVRAAVYRAMVRKVHQTVEESAADEITHDNASLTATNQDLRKQTELVSRELTLMQHRLAGHVADLEARAASANTLEGQRDIPQLQAMSLLLLRQSLPGEEHVLVVLDRQPTRVVSVARFDDDEVVIQLAEKKLARGVVRAVVKRRQTALIEDAVNSPILGDLADWVTTAGSVLVLPLLAAGVVQGVAVIRREQTGRPFGQAEVRRALRHCDEIGRAVETALAFRRQQAQTYAALKAIVEVLEGRAEQTQGHSRRVANWAGAVARRLRLNEHRIQALEIAGRLHDVGKVFLPRDLLEKVGPLTDDERTELAAHCEHGWRLLEPIAFLEDARFLVRWHHDLGGDSDGIGLDQQILATVEAFDEHIHDGPYGPACTAEEALSALQADGYDAEVLRALAAVALAEV